VLSTHKYGLYVPLDAADITSLNPIPESKGRSTERMGDYLGNCVLLALPGPTEGG
jgi:hypothetical protein